MKNLTVEAQALGYALVSESFLCVLCVLRVSVVSNEPAIHHRVTKNTKDAQREN
jgi:hypothetical protein